jgi:hypothetical protein
LEGRSEGEGGLVRGRLRKWNGGEGRGVEKLGLLFFVFYERKFYFVFLNQR